MTYETRYCAFVDILGFSGIIEELAKGEITPDLLAEVLDSVHRPREHRRYFTKESDLKAQSISDAVCLSSAHSANGLHHLFYSVQSLATSLLEKGGFLIRGGIVKGMLYHDENKVFGPALVKAYTLETNIALYPRIVVTSEVVAEAREYEKAGQTIETELTDDLPQAIDGPYYLHLLDKMWLITAQPTKAGHEEYLKRYNDMAEHIQRRFNKAVDNPHHFVKQQWFAKYWNDSARKLNLGDTLKQIEGPGLKIQEFIIGG